MRAMLRPGPRRPASRRWLTARRSRIRPGRAARNVRVRVQANRLVLGEAIAAAIEDVAGLPVVADTTDPRQVHRAVRPPHVVVVVGSRIDGSMSAAVAMARRRWRQSVVIAL